MNERSVCVLECVRQIQSNQCYGVRRQLLAGRRLEQGSKVHTIDELECHVVHAVDLSEIDHANDVGVAKPCSERGLASKTGDELGVIAERRKRAFQTNPLLESTRPGTGRFERFRHATDAEAAHNMIGTELARLTSHPSTSLASSEKPWRADLRQCRLSRY